MYILLFGKKFMAIYLKPPLFLYVELILLSPKNLIEDEPLTTDTK